MTICAKKFKYYQISTIKYYQTVSNIIFLMTMCAKYYQVSNIKYYPVLSNIIKNQMLS